MKYLTLIQAVTLLHQYQREIKRAEHRGQVVEYVEVQPSDIRLANRLAHEVLGRTLDEMPPQMRKLLLLIQAMVRETAQRSGCEPSEVRFTRRDIRAYTSWSDSQLKHHCIRLSEMEYLLTHGGSRGQLLRYELLWDGGSGEENHLCGLLSVEEPAKSAPDSEGGASKFGSESGKPGSGSGQVRSKFRQEKVTSEQATQGQAAEAVRPCENAVIRAKKKTLLPPSPPVITNPFFLAASPDNGASLWLIADPAQIAC